MMKVLSEGATYKLDFFNKLCVRGLNNAFHMSLLHLHFLNDDYRFLDRQFHQLLGFRKHLWEWAVDRILLHVSKELEAEFEVQ